MRNSRNYALLQDNTITILPPLSEASLAALQQHFAGGQTLKRANGDSLALVVPLSATDTLSFETVHPVDVVYGDQVQLSSWRGADRLTPSPQQDTTLQYTLEWRPQRQLGHYYGSFLQLQTQEYKGLGGFDNLIMLEWLYPSTFWKTSDHVPDTHLLKIPAKLPTGAYRLVAGFYAYTDRPLPAFTSQGQPLGNGVTIGWLKVPQASIPTIPASATRVEADFNGYATLRAVSVEQTPQDISHVTINLYWQATQNRPPIDPNIFVHITGQNNQIIAQQDVRPWNGQYPMFIWDKDEIVQTTHTLDIGTADLSNLALSVGLYTFPDAVRVPVSQGNKPLPDAVVPIGKLSDLIKTSTIEF